MGAARGSHPSVDFSTSSKSRIKAIYYIVPHSTYACTWHSQRKRLLCWGIWNFLFWVKRDITIINRYNESFFVSV